MAKQQPIDPNPAYLDRCKKRSVEIKRQRRHEVFPENRRQILNEIKEEKLTLTSVLFKQSERPVSQTEALKNQILIIYKNGTFDLLPQGINGGSVQAYLGVRFSRVEYWSLLPIPSKHHPTVKKGPFDGLMNNNDIYECE